MKLNWRKPVLWAALTAATVGAVALAAEADGPDVTPTYFALPLQGATANPVTCMENAGGALGLGYPMGVKLDGNGAGPWEIYLPLDETGGGVAVASGGPAPGGGARTPPENRRTPVCAWLMLLPPRLFSSAAARLATRSDDRAAAFPPHRRSPGEGERGPA